MSCTLKNKEQFALGSFWRARVKGSFFLMIELEQSSRSDEHHLSIMKKLMLSFGRLNPTPFKASPANAAPFSSSSEEKSKIVVEKREDIVVQPNVTVNGVGTSPVAVVKVEEKKPTNSKAAKVE